MTHDCTLSIDLLKEKMAAGGKKFVHILKHRTFILLYVLLCVLKSCITFDQILFFIYLKQGKK